MSRLDEIKARADAATKGPWLQDGPWWTDDGGSEPTALPCVVDASRALVVFPPDATDVGMKRPEDRAANMAFIAAAREDVPWLVSEIERAEAEVEWWKERFPCDGLCSDADLWRIIGQVTAERDALAAQVARVKALAERFDSVQEEHLLQDDCQCEMKDCYECGPWHACTHNGPPSRARQIRDALAGSESDTGAEEAGHRCEPYYSRAECGQCGWQEQWCVTCSRQMCGCATETTDQEDQS